VEGSVIWINKKHRKENHPDPEALYDSRIPEPLRFDLIYLLNLNLIYLLNLNLIYLLN
jgi:hypothetical protein